MSVFRDFMLRLERLDNSMNSSEQRLSSDVKQLLYALANPEWSHLGFGIWYAIDPSNQLMEQYEDHCLALRLGITSAELLSRLGLAKLGTMKAASWAKMLNLARCDTLSRLDVRTELTKARFGKVRWVQFSRMELDLQHATTDPLMQVAEVCPSRLQPVAAAKTSGHLRRMRERERRKRSLRDSSRSPSRSPGVQGSPGGGQEQLPPPPPPSLPRLTPREIFTRLGLPAPHANSAGVRLRDSLLDKRFHLALSEMAITSGGRRELVAAASAVVYAVLSVLAPAPLETAAALAVPRQRSVAADPLRLSLVSSAQPKGRKLLDLLAEQPMVLSLVESYIAATTRKEPMAVRAPILAPLTAQYSLRIFNECFEVQLREAKLGPVKRYSWRFARWHAVIWLAGQAAPPSRTERWRFKDHQLRLKMIEFLTSESELQQVAYGVRRIKKSDGTFLDLPDVRGAHPKWTPHPQMDPPPPSTASPCGAPS